MQKLIIFFIFLNLCNCLKPKSINLDVMSVKLLEGINNQETANIVQRPDIYTDRQRFRDLVVQTRAEGNDVVADTAELVMNNIERFTRQAEQRLVTISDFIIFWRETMIIWDNII